MRILIFLSLCSALAALPVMAQEAESGGKVTIENGDQELINEFRINGQLYMIRVTPKKGHEYYLVDSDGDGNLETRWNELAPDLLIPAWVLKRW
jgi:hypothetical protein